MGSGPTGSFSAICGWLRAASLCVNSFVRPQRPRAGTVSIDPFNVGMESESRLTLRCRRTFPRNHNDKRAIGIVGRGVRQIEPCGKLQHRLEWTAIDFMHEHRSSSPNTRARAFPGYLDLKPFSFDFDITWSYSTQLDTNDQVT